MRKLSGIMLCLVLAVTFLSGCAYQTPVHSLEELRDAFLLPGAAVVSSSRGVTAEMFTYTVGEPFEEVTGLLEGRIDELGIRKTAGSTKDGVWKYEGRYGDSTAPDVLRLRVTDQGKSSEVSVKYGTDERENVFLQPIGNREAEAALIPESSHIRYINAGRIELVTDLSLADLHAFYTAALEQELGINEYGTSLLDSPFDGIDFHSTYRTGTEPDFSVLHLYRYDRLTVTVTEVSGGLRNILIRYPAAVGPDGGAASRTKEELAALLAPPGAREVTWQLYACQDGADLEAVRDWYLQTFAENGFTVLDVHGEPEDGTWQITGTYAAREYFTVYIGRYVQMWFSMYA